MEIALLEEFPCLACITSRYLTFFCIPIVLQVALAEETEKSVSWAAFVDFVAIAHHQITSVVYQPHAFHTY